MEGLMDEGHVGYDKKFKTCLANRLNGALDHAMGAELARATGVLGFRQSEKNDPGDSERLHLTALLHNLIDRLLMDAWHGADFLALVCTRTHEHRIDEAGRGKPRLSN